MKHPEISIVMPVSNSQLYLPETIASIQNQTFSDFEVICVDDGSTDESAAILTQTLRDDSRFRLIRQARSGAGAARNRGFEASSGNYVIFLDSENQFTPSLLKKLHQAMIDQQADIAACDYSLFSPDGSKRNLRGVFLQWLPKGAKAFHYLDCPDRILSVVHPAPGNKLYRSDFLRDRQLKFEEIPSADSIVFSTVSVAMAEKIAVVSEALVRYRVGPEGSTAVPESLDSEKNAVLRAAAQSFALPYGPQIIKSILSFVIDHFLCSLSQQVTDFSNPEAASFYQAVHECFNQPEFADIHEKMLVKPQQYLAFLTVKKHDYETMQRLVSRRLIVSLTTYPKRIHLIPQVLESIFSQTRKPDEIVLWLAQEQFPGKENDLPEAVNQLAAEKKLTIRWCDDLKPHKKYFYALQEFSDDLVVTIDDDLLYSPNMLSSLYASYLLYPDAVSTVRAHLIVVDEANTILPYRCWIQETDSCIHEPSMQLLATNGAGVLHPPGLYRKETFDTAAVMENCLWADDLWLKAMQLVSDVPVVVARPHEPLNYIPGSQADGLHTYNVRQNQNDVQWANITHWLDKTFAPGILRKKLTQYPPGRRILGVQAISAHLDAERKYNRNQYQYSNRKWKETENKLRDTERERKQTEQALHQAQAQFNQTSQALSQAQAQLKQLQDAKKKLEEQQKKLEAANRQTQDKLTQAEAKLAQTKKELQLAKENSPISRQLKNLGAQIRSRRANGERLLRWGVKYFVYLLAWIPEKILAVMMYYLRNGAKESLKHLLRKLFRKK